jgi:hypothetical protein
MTNWIPKLISPWDRLKKELLTLHCPTPLALEDTTPALFSKKLPKLGCESLRPLSEIIGKRRCDVFQ